ncbi:DUF3576 domain-containing protein [Donghicola tyrosinivorans]|uniref:Uncharacterized protein DUF3576 n=1 Tax=Donghicola tyrosinivorans TaxID=1652492 RepID=A0A2T0WYQ0_9RHOB|nr:DUF3576 domain-containing protein [Donghicola tyrosinivorans]PRY91775.1 uncharacterized protein DUF3576 [Donghicola tyrosinivorans]
MFRAMPRFAIPFMIATVALTGCGKFSSQNDPRNAKDEFLASKGLPTSKDSKFLDLLKQPDREEVGEVNRYLWNASLEVLNFLPIETIDPFTGVIVTGLGTPPGGGRAYKATIFVSDSALDARSLNVALKTSNGQAVSVETQRAVEDAILTRARQLRVADLGR